LRIKDSEGKEEDFFLRFFETVDLSEFISGGYSYFFNAPFMNEDKHKIVRKLREYVHIEEAYFPFVDCFIARSEEEKSVLMDYYNIPSSRVVVVTGGINQEDWTGIAKNAPKKNDQIILVSASRISKQKNLDSSIEITRILRSQGFNILFNNFGKDDDPDYKKSLVKKIHGYDLTKNFFLKEHLPEEQLNKEYEKADFFIHPSNYESFGLSILEAMASGTPIVATNKGGPNEFVSNGDDGYLLDPTRPDRYAEIIIELLKDPAKYKQLSEKAIRKANQLSWDNYAEKHLDVYEKVLYRFRRRKKITSVELPGFDADLKIRKV
jgi:glycosyltransferase involved in cell wall biosynthesis